MHPTRCSRISIGHDSNQLISPNNMMRSNSMKQYNQQPNRSGYLDSTKPSHLVTGTYSASPPNNINTTPTIWQYDQSMMNIPPYMSSPAMMLTAQLPPKGKIQSLKREESHGIPIPGRAQSHDDIHLLSSPRSPASGRYSPSKFIICGSTGSPPTHHYGQTVPSVTNSVTNSSVYSYSASPLSSSVPTGGGIGIHRLDQLDK